MPVITFLTANSIESEKGSVKSCVNHKDGIARE